MSNRGQKPTKPDPAALAVSLMVGARIIDAFTEPDEGAFVFVLSSGASVMVMSDPEGNGPGSLHIYNREGKDIARAGGH